METLLEQRMDTRTNLAWPVSIWLPEAHRFFNGRSRDVSKTGVFLTLPATTPVKAGQMVEINFPRTAALAKQKGSFSRIKSGKVVRVDRHNLLSDANVGIGVQFE